MNATFIWDDTGAEVALVSMSRGRRMLDLTSATRVLFVRRGEIVVRSRGSTSRMTAGDAPRSFPCEALAAIANERAERAEIVVVRAPALALARGAPPATTDDARALLRERDTSHLVRALLGWARFGPACSDAHRAVEPRSIRRARLHLHAHHARTIRLDELAAVAEASKYHLVRTFRGYHGVPPHTYLVAYRIARAQALLASGETCARAATSAGFSDQSHFARTYRAMVGAAPSTYARGATRHRSAHERP